MSESDASEMDIVVAGAERILAIVDRAPPDAVRQLGEDLVANQGGTLRGIGWALSIGGAYSELYVEQHGEAARPRFRLLALEHALSEARHGATTDALAADLVMSGDELWVAVGETLQVLREAWHRDGGL